MDKDFLVVYLINNDVKTELEEHFFENKKEVYEWYQRHEPNKIILNIIEL